MSLWDVTDNNTLDYSPKIMSEQETSLSKSYIEALSQGETHRDVFDWPSAFEVLDKVIEEANELKEAIRSQNDTETFTEASDLVFTVVQCLRHLNLDLGDCLNYSNKKFKVRFEAMNKLAKEKKLKLKDLDLNKLETLWGEAKKISKNDVASLSLK
jgi:uncharacterized protein YabN with tetrapyrrole methylase and pyrophosphatase domain